MTPVIGPKTISQQSNALVAPFFISAHPNCSKTRGYPNQTIKLQQQQLTTSNMDFNTAQIWYFSTLDLEEHANQRWQNAMPRLARTDRSSPSHLGMDISLDHRDKIVDLLDPTNQNAHQERKGYAASKLRRFIWPCCFIQSHYCGKPFFKSWYPFWLEQTTCLICWLALCCYRPLIVLVSIPIPVVWLSAPSCGPKLPHWVVSALPTSPATSAPHGSKPESCEPTNLGRTWDILGWFRNLNDSYNTNQAMGILGNICWD